MKNINSLEFMDIFDKTNLIFKEIQTECIDLSLSSRETTNGAKPKDPAQIR